MERRSKFLFLGDSHLSRIAVEYENLKYDSLDCDFIPLPGPIASRLTFKDLKLIVVECNEDSFKIDNSIGSVDFRDFFKWYSQVKNHINSIEGCNSVNLNSYDAIVVVGLGLLNSEYCLRLAFKCLVEEYIDPSIYSDLINMQSSTMHVKFLDSIRNCGFEGKLFSVSNPYVSESSPFALDVSNSICDIHLTVFKKIRNFYAVHIENIYRSKSIEHPIEILSAKPVFTKSDLQASPTDWSHLSFAGSRIQLENILNVISNSVL